MSDLESRFGVLLGLLAEPGRAELAQKYYDTMMAAMNGLDGGAPQDGLAVIEAHAAVLAHVLANGDDDLRAGALAFLAARVRHHIPLVLASHTEADYIWVADGGGLH